MYIQKPITVEMIEHVAEIGLQNMLFPHFTISLKKKENPKLLQKSCLVMKAHTFTTTFKVYEGVWLILKTLILGGVKL